MEPRNKLKWQFGNDLYARETKPIHLEKSLENSYSQLQLLKKMESFKNTNKKWDKVSYEEKAMKKRMSMNSYSKKLQFNDVRNVVKKEIWKQAMLEMKQLKSSIQAKYAKQLLFYCRFGSTNKRKKKNYMSQINDQQLLCFMT
jgi:hypothetical protein